MRNVGKEKGEGAGCDGSVKTQTVGKERVYGSSRKCYHGTPDVTQLRRQTFRVMKGAMLGQAHTPHPCGKTATRSCQGEIQEGDIFLVSDDQGSVTVQILTLVTTETAQ